MCSLKKKYTDCINPQDRATLELRLVEHLRLCAAWRLNESSTTQYNQFLVPCRNIHQAIKQCIVWTYAHIGCVAKGPGFPPGKVIQKHCRFHLPGDAVSTQQGVIRSAKSSFTVTSEIKQQQTARTRIRNQRALDRVNSAAHM